MILLKGDIVRTKTGETGELIEVWGLARTFARMKPQGGGRIVLLMDSDVAEVLRRTAIRSMGGR